MKKQEIWEKQDKALVDLNVLTIVVGHNFKNPLYPETGLTAFIFKDRDDHLWDYIITDTIEDAKERMNKRYDREFKYILNGKDLK